MRQFLIKKFIKDYENTSNPSVRQQYGKLAGIVGIISNGILCLLKIAIGVFSGSIAIIADGINNLTDASSSLITLIGFKLAAAPEDKAHPYGHARIEYLTGLFVSILILLIGFKLFTTSFDKIRSPEPVDFSVALVIVLLIAIGIKVWQALFNIRMGDAINSSALKATGTDSRNDVISTTAVLISILIGKLTGLQIDGYMGCLVALFIIYSGIQLIRETTNPLLGQPPDPELVSAIEKKILSSEEVLGMHDLVVHDYGPGRIFASAHAEIDAYGDFLKSHDVIDNIEKEVKRDYHVDLVIHMDPVDTKDPLVGELKEYIVEIIQPLPGVLSIHDLRIVAGYTHTNVIFDVVLSPECDASHNDLRSTLASALKDKDPTYELVATFDMDYTES